MNLRFKALTLSVGAALSATAASAEADFSGFYVGLSSTNILSGGITTFTDGNENLNSDELLGDGYGLHLGYDAPVGNFIIGGEISHSNNKATLTRTNTNGSVQSWREENKNTGISARIGYPINEFMPYMSVSYGNSDNTSTNAVTLSVSENDYTYTGIGLGVEMMVSEKIFAFGEVAKYEFDNKDEVSEAESTQLSFGVKFRF